MIKVVLDTNIVISAALKEESLPALLLSLALRKEIQAFVSSEMLSEYGEVLQRPKFGLRKKETEDLLEEIRKSMIIVYPSERISEIREDEADNRILECAKEAEADFIITGNKSHFPFEEFRGTKIVSPREFFEYFI